MHNLVRDDQTREELRRRKDQACAQDVREDAGISVSSRAEAVTLDMRQRHRSSAIELPRHDSKSVNQPGELQHGSLAGRPGKTLNPKQ